MKQLVTKFKSMKVALKELRQFITDGKYLNTGKPFEKFGDLRPRELLANWVVCAVLNGARGREAFEFTTAPMGGDGYLYDRENQTAYPTEHVLVTDFHERIHGRSPSPKDSKDLHDLILAAICKKQLKGGQAYARGKTLIVFLDIKGGPWSPARVARRLPNPSLFLDIWVVGLHAVNDGSYVYNATQLDVSQGIPMFLVLLSPDFDGWTVRQIQ
jgi:hypothetical protein